MIALLITGIVLYLIGVLIEQGEQRKARKPHCHCGRPEPCPYRSKP